MGGPTSPFKEKFRTNDALLMKNYGDFDPVTLEPFIVQLRQAKGEPQ